MTIIVNGKARTVTSTDLAGILEELGYSGARVATAHGGEFVPASHRAACRLRDGDRVEILAPMQGG
ncbi:sulfur carrier protein ThiS [Roseomonas marmotae]|uniref:Sulfur carrier protein ThiS n=1 Tax=Roseomonas marmotae TaxID=2768161 RepID=A0ABS3K8L2_9PROT|nr:sulfur carrier protein ThiS [Roseomonas marmotae]MBO1073811.1 sulfur carrier protein ThiS [Roseomonas marmotae]QTI78559.1 sulfur carrier protein ThiS [Roseomonas marmotae]